MKTTFAVYLLIWGKDEKQTQREPYYEEIWTQNGQGVDHENVKEP
jgi:hypothetical protein